MHIAQCFALPRITNLPGMLLLWLVLSVSLTTLLPQSSHAIPIPDIPVAGDYEFTSGLTGTFTSDGTRLTAWTIRGPWGLTYIGDDPSDAVQYGNTFNDFLVDTDPITHTIRTSFIFQLSYLAVGSHFPSTILYLEDWGNGIHGSTGHIRSGIAPYTRVPEPSSALLAGIGLLLLLGYGWRQRRHTGLQVE